MAEETCKLLGNKGQIVVVRMEVHGHKSPDAEAHMQTFLKTFSKRKGITVAGTEVLTIMPPPAPRQTFSVEMFDGKIKKPKSLRACFDLFYEVMTPPAAAPAS